MNLQCTTVDEAVAQPTRSTGRYRKVEVRTWGDERFRLLTPIPPCGQGLWLYLITGPHTGPIPGLFSAGRSAMAEDLGWSLDAFLHAIGEPIRYGMVKVDFVARVVWVPKSIYHNPPAAPNQVKSWGAEFDLIPECDLKREAYETLKASIHALGEGFGHAFDVAWRMPSPMPSVMPSPMPRAIQEQKQEQKQDIEISPSAHTEVPSVEADVSLKNGLAGRNSKTRNTTKNVHVFSPGFERFWRAYPRKVGKDAAASAFAKRKPDAALVDAMVAAIEAQMGSEQWCRGGGQFIPHPATWLNEGRWMDEQTAGSDVSPELAEMFRQGRA